MSAPSVEPSEPEAPSGLWMSISDIARARGVEKSSISRRVSRLMACGFSEVRSGPGGQKLINLAAFDRATEETTDAVREANGTGARASGAGRGGTLAVEQAKRTAYLAEMARLDLEERLGKIVPVENLTAAAAAVGETIVRALDQLPSRADDLATAVMLNGAHGARLLLKEFVYELRQTLSQELQALAARPAPPETIASPEAAGLRPHLQTGAQRRLELMAEEDML